MFIVLFREVSVLFPLLSCTYSVNDFNRKKCPEVEGRGGHGRAGEGRGREMLRKQALRVEN